MISLFTEEQYQKAKRNSKLPCECVVCHHVFYKKKHDIQTVLNGRPGDVGYYCSRKCQLRHWYEIWIAKWLNNEISGVTCKQIAISSHIRRKIWRTMF